RISDWFREALPGGLPPGDALIVADVDLDVTAVEVGTATPKDPISWLRVASVVAEHSIEGEISRKVQSVGQLAEPAARALELRRILEHDRIAPLQGARIRQLAQVESRGVPSRDLWDAIGTDCGIPNAVALQEL